MKPAYTLGHDAGWHGEPLSACPWRPSDPLCSEWTRGWNEATSARLQMRGQYGATREEIAAAAAAFDTPAVDPVAAIFDAEDEWAEPKPEPAVQTGIGDFIGMDLYVAVEKWQEAIDILWDVVSDTVKVFSVWVEEIVDVLPADPPAQRRRHGSAAFCPRHGETRGGTCFACTRRSTRSVRR